MTSNDFIKKAREIHGNKYDYSKVEYINSKTKVCIICPIHGEFWQIPYSHLKGFGCCKCGHDRTNNSKFSNIFTFIEKAKKVHGDKYNYSKVEYERSNKKVCIICPIHGEFCQTPNKHLCGDGCPKCGHKHTWDKRGRITTEEFIERARKVHGDKYDYSKVEYKNTRTKVCIICPIHAEFWQKPIDHLKGCKCPFCAGKNMNTKEFIRKAILIHGDKYDYSKVNFINSRSKICIICPKHGEFWMTASNHLSNHGCPKCKAEKMVQNAISNVEEFIEKARKVHGDKYDYSKVKYERSNKKVCIICPTHGEFLQTPNSHLRGCGCPDCAPRHTKYTTEEFIEKARKVHGDKYDYSKVKYIDGRTKVCIICPIHGEFWQTPDSHINLNQGCPICRESKLEKEIRLFLNENNIKYTQWKKFDWL